MAEASSAAALAMPDLLAPGLLDDSLASASSAASATDSSLVDISSSFNIDYMTMKHDAEIQQIKASLQRSSQQQQQPPAAAAAAHSRRRPSSTSSPPSPSSASPPASRRSERHALQLMTAEKELLEERVRMMERLLSSQSAEMEELVRSTAQLYMPAVRAPGSTSGGNARQNGSRARGGGAGAQAGVSGA